MLLTGRHTADVRLMISPAAIDICMSIINSRIGRILGRFLMRYAPCLIGVIAIVIGHNCRAPAS